MNNRKKGDTKRVIRRGIKTPERKWKSHDWKIHGRLDAAWGIVFLVVAFIMQVGLLYSLEKFIRRQVYWMRKVEFSLNPFAVVGAVVVGLLIMAGGGVSGIRPVGGAFCVGGE